MSFSLGIIGLPNVGKSTLFNALTNLGVDVANYPFTTIEPNVGIVAVPDERLQKLAALEKPEKIIPTAIEFKDIAGLVKNAHQGEGLGNQFLSHIREVDAIVEIVRVFADPNVTHVSGSVDPQRDLEIIETELILADLQLLENKLETLKSAAKSGKHEDILKVGIGEKYYGALSAGKFASTVNLNDEEKKYLHEFPLLTNKPILYVANAKFDLEKKKFNAPSHEEGQGEVIVNHNHYDPLFFSPSRGGENPTIILDCQLESELSELSEDERKEYLKELGLAESGLTKLIKAAYQILGLITFFTRQSNILQAWTCRVGTRAPQAAGLIHTDFEKGFIKAEVINWQTLLSCGGSKYAHEKGLLRTEGKDYMMQDGDVVNFRHAP
jgi:hypothetical protein